MSSYWVEKAAERDRKEGLSTRAFGARLRGPSGLAHSLRSWPGSELSFRRSLNSPAGQELIGNSGVPALSVGSRPAYVRLLAQRLREARWRVPRSALMSLLLRNRGTSQRRCMSISASEEV